MVSKSRCRRKETTLYKSVEGLSISSLGINPDILLLESVKDGTAEDFPKSTTPTSQTNTLRDAILLQYSSGPNTSPIYVDIQYFSNTNQLGVQE